MKIPNVTLFLLILTAVPLSAHGTASPDEDVVFPSKINFSGYSGTVMVCGYLPYDWDYSWPEPCEPPTLYATLHYITRRNYRYDSPGTGEYSFFKDEYHRAITWENKDGSCSSEETCWGEGSHEFLSGNNLLEEDESGKIEWTYDECSGPRDHWAWCPSSADRTSGTNNTSTSKKRWNRCDFSDPYNDWYVNQLTENIEELEDPISLVDAMKEETPHNTNKAQGDSWSLGSNSGANTLTVSGQTARFEATFSGLEVGATYKATFTFNVTSVRAGCTEAPSKVEEKTEFVANSCTETISADFPLFKDHKTVLDVNTLFAKKISDGPGESCGGGSCPNPVPGAAAASAGNSFVWDVALGSHDHGKPVGRIRLKQDDLTGRSYLPHELVFTGAAENVQLLHQHGALRQVVAPQAFVDVKPVYASGWDSETGYWAIEHYDIRFFHRDSMGAFDPSAQLYEIDDEVETPFVVWRVDRPENPPSWGDEIKQIRFTRIEPGSPPAEREMLITHVIDGSQSIWQLSEADGLRVTTRISEPGGTNQRVLTTTIEDGANQTAEHFIETFETFSWGERIISKVEDPNGAALTTTWEYYQNVNPSDPEYGLLKMVTRPSGYWERYEYDGNGVRVKTVAQFLDSSSSSQNDSDHRVIEIVRDYEDFNNDSSNDFVMTTVEKVLGQEVSRRQRVHLEQPVTEDGETLFRTLNIRTDGTSASLVTETWTHATGEWKGKTFRVSHPDGTVSRHTYEIDPVTNYLTTTVETGVENEVPPGEFEIVEGRRSLMTVDEFGNQRSRKTEDIGSGLTTGWQTVEDWDEFGRPTEIHHPLAGTYELQSYSCCGNLEEHTDEEGNVTLYGHDALGRQISVTRAGITMEYELDAMGRRLKVTRIGSDQSAIVQNVSEFDLAGRLVSLTDAVNNETTFSETFDQGSGMTVRTTTYADNSSRIETYYPDGSLESVSGTAAHPVKYEYGVINDGGVNAFVRTEIRIGYDGQNPTSTEWVKHYRDMFGRVYKREYPDSATEHFVYDDRGLLVRQIDADGVRTLFGYNDLGELEYTVVDVERNIATDDWQIGDIAGGKARITRTARDYLPDGDPGNSRGKHLRRSRTFVWPEDGNSTSLLLSTVEETLDGFERWEVRDGLETHAETEFPGPGERVETVTRPDGSRLVRTYEEGRLMEEEELYGVSTLFLKTNFTYDGHGRLEKQVDHQGNETVHAYYDDDRIQSVTLPDANLGGSAPGPVTAYEYDVRGRVVKTIHPDETETHSAYTPTGELWRTWGARTYPVEYGYDPQGRRTMMTTWQEFNGFDGQNEGEAETSWIYDSQRGWLNAKVYPDARDTLYTYTAAGRLETRKWSRMLEGTSDRITTTYGYTNAGDLWTVGYNDDTPNIEYAYNRLGQLAEVEDAVGLRTLVYNNRGLVTDEIFDPTSMFESRRIKWDYDPNTGHLASLQLRSATNTVLEQHDYSFNAAGRMSWASANGHEFHYSWATGMGRIGSMDIYSAGPTTWWERYFVYDKLGRTTEISTVGASRNHSYTYNTIGQRTAHTVTGSGTWHYGYDSLGQLTSGSREWDDETLVMGQQYGYSFDDIGNRNSMTLNSRQSTYTPDNDGLNQYASRTVPGAVDILGLASDPENIVEINGVPAQHRKGSYFYHPLPLDNTSSDVFEEIEIEEWNPHENLFGGANLPAVTGMAVLAKDPETFEYDADGNLLEDGRWAYTWDAENRLVEVKEIRTAGHHVAARIRLQFEYDYMGRRIRTLFFDEGEEEGVAPYPYQETRFIYDQWNCFAELNGSNTLTKSYLWGVDLSGTMHGAGGVGGLLMVRTHGTNPRDLQVVSDANGNVTDLIGLTAGSGWATYDYGPFGELIRATGPAAWINPFRYSTKYQDFGTGLLYYGYRYYSPSMGRWLNRDPINEPGSMLLRGEKNLILHEELNLYAMVANDAVNHWDYLGLACGPGDGFGEWIIPNRPGGFDFTPACEAHDRCYEDCSIPRSECDSRFRQDLYDICDQYPDERRPRRPGGPAVRPPPPSSQRDTCRLLASIYSSAVSGFGGPACRSARRNNPDCCGAQGDDNWGCSS